MDTEEIVREVAEKVREVVDTARRRADEIVREAEVEAEWIRSEAEADARTRLDQVRRSLAELESALGTVRETPPAEAESPSTAPASAREPEPQPPREPEPQPPREPEPQPQPPSEPEPQPPREPEPQPPREPEPQPPREPEPQPPPVTDKASTEELLERLAAGGGADRKAAEESAPAHEPSVGASDRAGSGSEAAARLVAMKLALDGIPRDEARQRLAADYDVADIDSLLDEVFAKAGKQPGASRGA
jgi:outer membrane biosynthesis protein TonB